MKNKSAKALWGDFLDQHLEYAFAEDPGVGYFGDTKEIADSCLELVLKGEKRATAHSLLGLQLRNEPLPKIGDMNIITDWEGRAHCIVRTVRVTLKPFFAVTSSYAQLEGEGDGSLEYWKKSHWEYYTRELAPFERRPLESMIVVFEVFEKIFEKK